MSHWRALTSETRDSLTLSLYPSWHRATARDTVSFQVTKIDRPYDTLCVSVVCVCVCVCVFACLPIHSRDQVYTQLSGPGMELAMMISFIMLRSALKLMGSQDFAENGFSCQVKRRYRV